MSDPAASLVAQAAADPALQRRQRTIIESFLDGKAPGTVRAYRHCLARVAAWSGLPGIDDFAAHFLSLGPGGAFDLANAFRAWGLGEQGWSPSYLNVHLAALRSLAKLCRRLGLITWTLDVDGIAVEPLRDTRGPGLAGIVKLLEAAGAQTDEWCAARDTALVWIFSTTALRLNEVGSLDMAHVDLAGRRLFALRKGKKERVWITIPAETVDTLQAWLDVRGRQPGPLFISRATRKRRPDGRLANCSLWMIIRDLAASSGIKARPHGLRHTAITEVLEMTNGSIRSAQKLAAHASPSTTMKYDDNRRDLAGDMAGKLAEAIVRARRDRQHARVSIRPPVP